MIQFDEDGSALALPLKSSAQTWVHPESGGGTEGCAAKEKGVGARSAAAPTASLRLDMRVVGMRVTSSSRSGRVPSACMQAANVSAMSWKRSHGAVVNPPNGRVDSAL